MHEQGLCQNLVYFDCYIQERQKSLVRFQYFLGQIVFLKNNVEARLRNMYGWERPANSPNKQLIED